MDVTTEHSDPGFVLWSWCQTQLDRSALPHHRTVVAFTFPDEAPANRYCRLLVEGGDGRRSLARALPTWNLHTPRAQHP